MTSGIRSILCSVLAGITLTSCQPSGTSDSEKASANPGGEVFPLACTKEAQEQFWTGFSLAWNGHDSEAQTAFARAKMIDPRCAIAKLYDATANPGPDSKKSIDDALADAVRNNVMMEANRNLSYIYARTRLMRKTN